MSRDRPYSEPDDEQLTKLSGAWCCSYSGGKDSTSLVTWIEWLRRSGQIMVDRPQLVQSDTTVEDPRLMAISRQLMACLRRSGWECQVVEPKIHEKLYNRIFGIGVVPIHPGIKNMRWCTRSTKIAPMERWRSSNSSGLTLTGLRLGESSMRDGKLKRHGCAAGGECGIPDPSDRTYSPILHWRICDVIEWLNGSVERKIVEVMDDLFEITRKLVEIYEVTIRHEGWEWAEAEVSATRFGCIGCPAISATRDAPRSTMARNGIESSLNELYDVWFEARRRENRLWSLRLKKQYGPIKMEVRKRLFDRVMDIQERAGVSLITPEDEAFIRECWENEVYPRGWSKDDELVSPPEPALFVNLKT